MTSKLDQQRLRDAERALVLPKASSIQEMESQISQLSDAIRALQSLDNLGIEANDRADRDAMFLAEKRNALEEKLNKVKLEIEALRLAKNKCMGTIAPDHVLELRRLAKAGLVRNVDTGHSAYYVLTEKGEVKLDDLESRHRSSPYATSRL